MSQLLVTPKMLKAYLQKQGWDWQECGLDYLDTLETVTEQFPLRISTYYADIINWMDPHDPLRLIAIPSAQETHVAANEVADPIGDGAREAVPGLIHRYPDRVLLLLTTQCRMHCRFCFRRSVVGKRREKDEERILQYIAAHPKIEEVIFSGGDPLMLAPDTLQALLQRLSAIEHIARIRFHTRIPVIDPDYVTQDLLRLISSTVKQSIVVLHCDHFRELTLPLKKVIKRLQKCGVLVLSQTVLLKGVNASVSDLRALFAGLLSCGVKPYYLHHLDQARGTTHFRISIAQGLRVYDELKRTTSPICLPNYVLDLPGGYGKVLVTSLQKIDTGSYEASTFRGETIVYRDPAVN